MIQVIPLIRVSAQDYEEVLRKEVFSGNYKISLSAGSEGFFRGSLKVEDIQKGKEVFSADSFYTRYNWDTTLDLNTDGSMEFVLDLGTGATMYDYNMFLIFDFSRDAIEPLEVHNAEFSFSKNQQPKILSYIRLSPAVMGAGYIYSLKYEDGRLILENDMDESEALKSLDTDGKDDLYLINEYSEGLDECAEDSQVTVYYEAYLMQQKILGKEDNGWKFFDKHYKCKNKKKTKIELKKIVDDSYSYISNPDNYKFSADNY